MMEFIKEMFLQTVFSSLKLSVVIILLFILTKPITKRYTAGFRYYSWLAVMLIFFIPFAELGIGYTIDMSPAITRGIHSMRNWYEEKAPEYSVTEEYVSYENISADNAEKPPERVQVIKTASAKKQVDIAAIVAVVWLIGALGYFGLHYGRYIYFRRTLKRLGSTVTDESVCTALDEERERLKISKPLRIRLVQLVDTPMLVGLVKPEIILPHINYTDDELRFLLRHELFHFKRKDILYQLITLVFVSLHWFNPIVHLMAKAIEIDGETSCDEKTLEGKAYEEKIFYGEMLIKFLKPQTQKRSYMTTTFFGGKNGMKNRLMLIKSKRARKKGITAMAIVMTAAIIIAVGAAAAGNGYFEAIFRGDTSYLADFVKTEKKSVEDDRFKLTLEQYLVTENQAVILYSFEAKTPDAVEELNSDSFWDMDTIIFGPTDSEKASCNGYGGYGKGGFSDKNKNKIYCTLASDEIANKEKIDFFLTTSKIKDSPKILVPMDVNMETKTVKCDDITVNYNPISISLAYPCNGDNKCDSCHRYGKYFYFRMKNGEIKTFSQLYQKNSGQSEVDENGNEISWTEKSWAKEVIKPDEIKSMVINDTEYSMDNPAKPKHIDIDNKLRPFVINGYVKEHLWLPLRELCDGLGAEIKWDNNTRSATVNYRGSEYVFTVGSTAVKINGETVDFYDELNDNAAFIDESGRMIVSSSFDDYMDIECHSFNMHFEDGNIKAGAKWHIIP